MMNIAQQVSIYEALTHFQNSLANKLVISDIDPLDEDWQFVI